ncbi:MAG: MHS family MFS transporter [Bacteroidota bacterium]|nr:MHS family MFS transporter [Bacteroidota bacterium]
MEETPAPSSPRTIRKVILASSAGTLIEWYDFYIFGSLSTIISERFFPKEHPTAAYLATLAIFATGFIVRPFGAIIFGRIGDRVGRKYTFLITLLLMGLSTFAIGLVPGFGRIGIAAPIIVLLLRLIQGLALGGEYGGAAIYVAEYSPPERRGFFTSFIQTTATFGLFISIAVILATRACLKADEFNSWGWRIPFLLSIVLVMVSYIIRRKLHESPEFSALKASGKTSKNPIKESFGKKENLKWVLLALFGACAGQGVVWYTGQFYALTFLQKTMNIEFVQSNVIIAAALILGTPLFIYFGRLSDTVGRKKIMMTGLILAALAYYPIYKTMYYIGDVKTKTEISKKEDGIKINTLNVAGPCKTETNVTKCTYTYSDGTIYEADSGINGKKIVTLSLLNCTWLSLLIFIQVVFVTMVYGPIAAFLVELFPARIRYTSLSLPYHIGNGVFGGLTPFIAASVVASTGNPFSGLIYPISVALITFIIGMFFIKKRTMEIEHG